MQEQSLSESPNNSEIPPEAISPPLFLFKGEGVGGGVVSMYLIPRRKRIIP